MPTHRFTIAVWAVIAVLAGSPARAQTSASGCTPNGNRFNRAPLKNAVGQYDESVAVLVNRGIGGADLVVGTALDVRSLPPLGFLPGQNADAFYVQRDGSGCAADLEGELPRIASSDSIFDIFGSPVVVADPAHDAFFVADLRFGGLAEAVGLVKTTPAILDNTSTCPDGTESNPAACFVPVAKLSNKTFLTSSSGIFEPSLAVDQRTTGTGAGDVYVTVVQTNVDGYSSWITLAACTNKLTVCGGSVTISGSDNQAGFPWVQVRPDGGTTVSYVQLEKTSSINPVEIRFVNCAPAGAPRAPACAAPVPVLTENQPPGIPGEVLLAPQNLEPITLQPTDVTYPKHVNRLESDGANVTTFLIYDRCEVADVTGHEIYFPLCPKTDVVVTSSTDGGATWSPIQKVSAADGQQFFGNIALDASTGTVNIAYYSTENDPLKTRTQVFLAQIPPSQTSPGVPHQLTSALYDGAYGGFNGDDSLPGQYLGIAAGGTGVPGQSRVYVHFTGSVALGNYGGALFPVTHNILTSFQY